MSVLQQSVCPGCGLSMPARGGTPTRSYYNASAECWDLYTEVLATEYSNAVLFGQIHQVTVDAYAVQHAGGPHPAYVPPLLQRLVAAIEVWPHYEPAVERVTLNVFDVAMCDSVEDHICVVREWGRAVWACWAGYHGEVARLISHHLDS